MRKCTKKRKLHKNSMAGMLNFKQMFLKEAVVNLSVYLLVLLKIYKSYLSFNTKSQATMNSHRFFFIEISFYKISSRLFNQSIKNERDNYHSNKSC